jgi:glycerophosphoryl diester phosphodiesterase
MLIIGHRGTPAEAPENTFAAFDAALEAGADGIETDIRITTDGALVLSHDDAVALGGRISELTLRELRAHVPVVLAEDMLARYAGRTRLFLECKGIFEPGRLVSAEPVARALLPLLAEVPNVTVSSFDPTAITAVRALAPEIPVGLGCAEMFPPHTIVEMAAASGYEQVHPADVVVTEDVVTTARALGVELAVWTVNDLDRANELREWGVGAIFTDDPRRIRSAAG